MDQLKDYVKELYSNEELLYMAFIDETQSFVPDEQGYLFFVPSRLVWKKFNDFMKGEN